jgi:hypothetical protein
VTVGGVPASVTSGGTTDPSGNATIGFSIPNVAPGSQPIVVADGTSSAVASGTFLATAIPRPQTAIGEIVGVAHTRAGAASSALHIRLVGSRPAGVVTVVLRSSSRTGVLAVSRRGPWRRTLSLTLPAAASESAPFYSRETLAGVATISAAGNAAVGGFQETVTAAAPARLQVRPAHLEVARGTTGAVTSVVLDRYGNVSRAAAVWTSPAPAIAGISASRGTVVMVRGVHVGHTVVVARWKRFHASVIVIVTRS